MTEPAVASSDARNIETLITATADDYVINGRKWWTTGAADPRCKILIVMGRTNPDAASHQQQSMVLVPVDTQGCRIERSTPVFGWQDQHGHCEIVYDNVRVPVENLLGEEGAGLRSPRPGWAGPHHHCMRAMGAAERALALMVDRVQKRIAFGKPLAEQGVVREADCASRNEIDQAGCCVRRRRGPSTSTATRKAPSCWSLRSRRSPRRWRAMSSTARSRCTARRASATTPCWPGCTAGTGRCGCSTAPTRCTCAPSRAPNSAARSRLRRGGDELVAVDVGELSGAWNFRDVAEETGVRPGRFFRSSELSRLDDSGREVFRQLGITDVADLRSAREVERHGPGLVPSGVEVHLCTSTRCPLSMARRRTRPRSRR